MYADLPRPTIFAHRGSSAYAPENTLAAFTLALRQKAVAIELDAKLSRDGEVVVIHDQTVDRTTDGYGQVNQLPLAALKELDAGSFFDASFRGEKIPTLAEVFETVGQHLFINIELTSYRTPSDSLPEKVAALVKHHGMEEHIMFSSFLPTLLRRAHKLLPTIPIGLIVPHIRGKWIQAILGRLITYQALHTSIADVTPALIQKTHQKERRIHVYTVNQKADMQRLFAAGVDGIFTDDLPLAQQVLDESRSA